MSGFPRLWPPALMRPVLRAFSLWKGECDLPHPGSFGLEMVGSRSFEPEPIANIFPYPI